MGRSQKHSRNARRPSAEPTFASLFSGCGGFDDGFRMRGIRPTAAFDIDQQAIEAYNANLPGVGRVLDLGLANPDIRRPDILLAGSPCQGFSTSGKRLVSDPRNNLLVRAGQIALGLLPKVFILENVPAAISGKHETRWRLVEDMLRWHGYNVRRFIAVGPESGVPQLRRRLFLVAWFGSDCIRFEPPMLESPSLREALKDVDQVDDHDPVFLKRGSREYRIARHIGAGEKLSNVRSGTASVHTWDIPEVFGEVSRREIEVLGSILRLRRRDRKRDFGDGDPVAPSAISRFINRDSRPSIRSLLKKGYLRKIGRHVELRHTYNGKFRRLDWNKPSPTVDTHFGDPVLFLHPDEHRGLSPREAARIQGFRDTFRLLGSRHAQFQMIGNAVPPPMGMRLAAFVRAALL
jgi:DNA (cytosine-5)-methyltransferase 1